MRASVLVMLLAAVALAEQPPSSTQTNAAATAADQELIALTKGRATALAAGDCQGWAKYVAPNFHAIEGAGSTDRAEMLKECAGASNLPSYKQERVLSDFHVQRIGNTAVVDCQYQTIEHFGEVTLTGTIHQVSTYEKSAKGWLVVLAVNVPIAHDPPAAEIDPATLDAFTGRYAWVGAPDIVDTVSRKDGKLYLQGTGDPAATELIPQGGDTFFIHGSTADRMTFLRDADGKVIAEDGRSADGQGVHATRIK